MDDDWLTERFEADRTRLHAVAYRMLGSDAEADDAVQDAWLRLRRTDADAIDNLSGWLTTVVARLCLDRLRARTARREAGGLDELGEAPDPTPDRDPATQAVVAESVGAALLVVLDSLGPAERVAFVLHDVFAVPFDEIAEIVGRTPEATRQLASRARRRVQGSASPESEIDPVQHREVVDAFLRAARGGDFEGLVRLLAPDVVLRPDAAALAMGSLTETSGATEVATMLAGGAKAARRAVVDGLAALVWAPGGDVRGVIRFTLVDGRIASIDVTGDPAQIGRADIVLLDA